MLTMLDYCGGESPAGVPGVNLEKSDIFHMCRRAFYQRALSKFKFRFPRSWDPDFSRACLFEAGALGVFYTDRFGYIPQFGGLSGYNLYYRPTNFVVANPCLIPGQDTPQSGIFRIWRPGMTQTPDDCTIIKLQPDYRGVMDVVDIYAELLSITLQDVAVNLYNSKLSYVFMAKNQNGADSLKKLYTDIASGKPAAIIDKKLLNDDGTPTWQFISQNVSANYIVTDLLADARTIVQMFDTEIGINNIQLEKKERLISGEIDANRDETESRAEIWLETLQAGIDHTVERFPELDGQLAVEMRFTQNVPRGTPEGSDA